MVWRDVVRDEIEDQPYAAPIQAAAEALTFHTDHVVTSFMPRRVRALGEQGAPEEVVGLGRAGAGLHDLAQDGLGLLRVAGLASSFSLTNPSSIAFGIRLQGSVAEVRESGVYRRDTTFAAGEGPALATVKP